MEFDYTILGAGAVGCVFGGLLAQQGKKVQLVNRSADLGLAVAAKGLRLELDSGLQTSQPTAVQIENAMPARVVMIFTKTHQSRAALKAILPQCDPNTIFVSLQNGLGNGASMAEITGSNRIFHGVTMLPATMVEPGLVRSHGSHKTWFGPLNPENHALGQGIHADLYTAGFDAEYVPSASGVIWQKACFNVALNAICALSLASPGLVENTPALKAAAHRLADEAILVAAAEGVTVDGVKVHDLINFACANHSFHKPSMLQDIEHNRETEIESLNGHLVKLAKKHGLDLPLNQMIYGLILGRQTSITFWQTAPKA